MAGIYSRDAMTIINPSTLASPRGYSHGVIGEGRVLFVAGQIGWNEKSEIVSEDFADQFDQALANVLAVIREAGGSPEMVARLTVYVVDKREYLAARRTIGDKYRARVGRHFPAMTLVEVKSLLEEAARVEIEATAIIPNA